MKVRSSRCKRLVRQLVALVLFLANDPDFLRGRGKTGGQFVEVPGTRDAVPRQTLKKIEKDSIPGHQVKHLLPFNRRAGL